MNDMPIRTYKITDGVLQPDSVRETPARKRSSGKVSLPPKRASKPYRETADVADAVCRLIKTIGKRVATEDSPDLEHLQAMDAALRTAWQTAIAGIRESGASDRDIGRALGVSRQAVEQRWPR